MPSLEGAPAPGKTYWRSLDELADTAEFRQWLHREFPAGATEMLDSGERRHFLRIMGASLALAGLGLPGCRRWPKEKIVPFAHRPDGRVPGTREQFATALEVGGDAQGLLVTSYDGRPVKIEGNPQHPINHGASDSWAQASILELYDPDRTRRPRRAGDDGQREDATWPDFDGWAGSHFQGVAGARGSGLAILSGATRSPSLSAMKKRVLEKFPRATWHEYEPLPHDGELAGARAAFGAACRPLYALDRARVIVSLDEDFLLTHSAAVKYGRDFARGRRAEDAQRTMNRLYVFESAMSLTGANADHRFAVRSRDVAAVAGHLAARLVPDALPQSPAARDRFDEALSVPGIDVAALDRIAEDLREHAGDALVVAGARQPAEVHVLAHAINERLGNVGRTVRYVPLPQETAPHVPSIKSLVQAMAAGKVTTLVILGGNPVYDAPANLEFGKHLASVRTSLHLSLHDDETSRLCTWHLPRAHYLEAWGDARAADGTWTMVQPLIEPLFGGRSNLELLAVVAADDTTAGYDIVRRTFPGEAGTPGFEPAWRAALHEGFRAESDVTPRALSLRDGAAAEAAEALWQAWAPAAEGELELVFVPDAKVRDGRFANNGWLQELPDPVTKLTWDNAALIGPEAAQRRGLRDGDVVRIRAGEAEVEAAVMVVPGQHPDSVTLPLGYGRATGRIAAGAGFDFYPLRTADSMWLASGAALEKSGGRYELARTQDHYPIDDVGRQGMERRLPSIFREATVREYREHPGFAHGEHVVHSLSLWPETNLQGATYAWGMTIDLTACTGCSACVVACQAENNIPVVGKDQVKRGREMHWIRVDRYFRGDPARPDAVALQPIPCMQCENAPCEQVCPVAATVHDKDGINVMVYNRCVGTRYCSNNCPYKVRRFNYFDYQKRKPVRETGYVHVEPDYYTEPQSATHPLRQMQFNPDVTVRSRGVMEKCTYCIQRITNAKIEAKNRWMELPAARKAEDPRVTVPDGSLTTACAQACPAEAIVFGDLMDRDSRVSAQQRHQRCYSLLDAELNTKPRTKYLAKLRNPAPALTPAPPPDAREGASHG